MKRILMGLLLVAVVSTPGRTQTLTAGDRARIEGEVRKVVDETMAAAKVIDYARISATMSKHDGVCLFPDTIESCQKVLAGFREEWTSKAPDRFVRQEMKGTETRVIAISPTVAVAASTTKENRAIRNNGKAEVSKFATFTVYVLEDGKWKAHSGMQVGWPISPAAQD